MCVPVQISVNLATSINKLILTRHFTTLHRPHPLTHTYSTTTPTNNNKYNKYEKTDS